MHKMRGDDDVTALTPRRYRHPIASLHSDLIDTIDQALQVVLNGIAWEQARVAEFNASLASLGPDEQCYQDTATYLATYEQAARLAQRVLADERKQANMRAIARLRAGAGIGGEIGAEEGGAAQGSDEMREYLARIADAMTDGDWARLEW